MFSPLILPETIFFACLCLWNILIAMFSKCISVFPQGHRTPKQNMYLKVLLASGLFVLFTAKIILLFSIASLSVSTIITTSLTTSPIQNPNMDPLSGCWDAHSEPEIAILDSFKRVPEFYKILPEIQENTGYRIKSWVTNSSLSVWWPSEKSFLIVSLVKVLYFGSPVKDNYKYYYYAELFDSRWKPRVNVTFPSSKYRSFPRLLQLKTPKLEEIMSPALSFIVNNTPIFSYSTIEKGKLTRSFHEVSQGPKQITLKLEADSSLDSARSMHWVPLLHQNNSTEFLYTANSGRVIVSCKPSPPQCSLTSTDDLSETSNEEIKFSSLTPWMRYGMTSYFVAFGHPESKCSSCPDVALTRPHFLIAQFRNSKKLRIIYASGPLLFNNVGLLQPFGSIKVPSEIDVCSNARETRVTSIMRWQLQQPGQVRGDKMTVLLSIHEDSQLILQLSGIQNFIEKVIERYEKYSLFPFHPNPSTILRCSLQKADKTLCKV